MNDAHWAALKVRGKHGDRASRAKKRTPSLDAGDNTTPIKTNPSSGTAESTKNSPSGESDSKSSTKVTKRSPPDRLPSKDPKDKADVQYHGLGLSSAGGGSVRGDLG